MRRSLFAAVVCASVVTIGYGQTAAEQATPKRPWVQVTVVRVKPDMATEFEKSVLPDLNAALKKAGVRFHAMWQTANYGELGEYVSAIPLENFAVLDGPPLLTKGLGAPGADQLLSRIRRCINGAERYALQEIPELSIEPKAEPKLAVVTTYRIASGRSRDFERFLGQEFVPALRKADATGYLVHRRVFGGDADSYVNLRLINNYAEIDKGPILNRAIGREAAEKMMTGLNGIVVSTERTLSQFRPEFSFQPAPQQ